MTQNRKRKIQAILTNPMEMGKLPPQAVDLEEAVLGAMLLEKEAVETVISILSAESFYKEQNGRVFNAIFSLYKRSEAIDILTVTQELRKTEELEIIGGAYYVSTLTNRIASSANIEFHARIIAQKQLAREIIRINTLNIKNAYDDTADVFEIYSQQANEMEVALGNLTKHDASPAAKVFSDFIDESIRVNKTGESSGVPTGLKHVDRFTSGWQKGDLIIIAGRPGMGKTAFGLSCAYKAAIDKNIPIAFFSLEMPKEQLIARVCSARSEFDLGRVSKKQLSMSEIVQMEIDNKILYSAPLYIDDTPSLTLIDVKSRLRRLVAKNGVKAAYIDYLQLMSSGAGKDNREQEIATISRGLKILAKELDIPIIAFSQLNRSVESRPMRIPMLSDLRESGAIEQDADMVIFTYRPEYYGFEDYMQGNESFPSKNLFVAIVAKHRNGGLGDLILGFKDEYAKLTDWDFENKRPVHTPIYTVDNPHPGNLADKPKVSTFVQQTEEGAAGISGLQTNTGFLSENTTAEPPPF